MSRAAGLAQIATLQPSLPQRVMTLNFAGGDTTQSRYKQVTNRFDLERLGFNVADIVFKHHAVIPKTLPVTLLIGDTAPYTHKGLAGDMSLAAYDDRHHVDVQTVHGEIFYTHFEAVINSNQNLPQVGLTFILNTIRVDGGNNPLDANNQLASVTGLPVAYDETNLIVTARYEEIKDPMLMARLGLAKASRLLKFYPDAALPATFRNGLRASMTIENEVGEVVSILPTDNQLGAEYFLGQWSSI